jgi:histidinol-phosphate aminotransferase
MRAAVNARTRLVFIANPNNPTGTWLRAAELEAFIGAMPAHVLVAVDEAYFEYVEEREYPNTIGWTAKYPNLVTARTFSKAYGLAGLRVGYGVSSPAVADVLNRVRQLIEAFKELGLEHIPSAGNFICVDFKRPATTMYEALLRQGVIVRPVANYGMPNHLRVTVGLPEENKRFIKALEKVIREP